MRDTSNAHSQFYLVLLGSHFKLVIVSMFTLFGAATAAASASLPPCLVKTLGGWSSDCYDRYIPQRDIGELLLPRTRNILVPKTEFITPKNYVFFFSKNYHLAQAPGSTQITRTLATDSNFVLTRSNTNFCFSSDHFNIILPSLTRTMF